MSIHAGARFSNSAGKVLLAVLSVLCFGAPAAAQRPFQPKNLKVLPKDISRQDLMRIMDGFTQALDVRCSHCHAQDAQNPRRLDYASDQKEAKKVARVMIRMTRTINQQLLPETGLKNRVRVQCVTCHHGAPEPVTLKGELRTAFKKGGLNAAVARYKALRDEYYGRATYDFGEPSLVAVGRDFLESKDYDAAEKFLNMNLEYFPKSAETYVQLSEVYRARGNREGALKALQKALEIEPNNRRIRRWMEHLKSQG